MGKFEQFHEDQVQQMQNAIDKGDMDGAAQVYFHACAESEGSFQDGMRQMADAAEARNK